MTQTRHRATEAAVMSLSKAALADIVVDLIRQQEGDELLDGQRLAIAVAQAAEPICNVRKDRLISPTVFWDSMTPEFREQHLERVKAARKAWEEA